MNIESFLRQVAVAIKFEDGSMRRMSFFTVGRGDSLPHGAQWYNQEDDAHLALVVIPQKYVDGFWIRLPNEENLFAEIMHTFEAALDGKPHPVTGEPMPKPVGHRLLPPGYLEDDSNVPYRDARVDTGKEIAYDLPKAAQVHRERLRLQRKPLLDALDVAYMRALPDEDDDEPARLSVVSEKRRLRDITADARIEKVATLDELKALTLDVLKG